MKTLRYFFAAPVFEGDEDKTGRARVLHIILITQGCLLTLLFVLTMAVAFSTPKSYIMPLFLLAVQIFLIVVWRFLMWRGQVSAASIGLIIVFTASLTSALASGGTVRTPNILFLVAIVVMATVLIGKRAGIVFFVITSIIGIGLVFAELGGLLPHPDNLTTGILSIAIVAGLGPTTLLLYLAKQNTENALRRAFKNEHDLRLLTATLEQRVADRAAIAEAARLEAETATAAAQAARKELEAQVWLVTGQAQLADATRGEQNISGLAENIITQISQYLGAQAGALYLLEKETLKLAGSYAFTMRPGFDGKFQLGEGLVGQAAADNRMMLITRPENTTVISTGLLDLTPRQVLAVPFEENGQVAGVFELAALTEFTQTHIDFLTHISESIGIAFRTVQARQRLADALMETQQQAEELQAQEEELRAANEELQVQAENLKSARKNKR